MTAQPYRRCARRVGTPDALRSLIAGIANQPDLLNRKLDRLPNWLPRSIGRIGRTHRTDYKDRPRTPVPTFRDAMQRMRPIIADRTYNTSYPDYDAQLVRNFPGQISNPESGSQNSVLKALRRWAQGYEIPDEAWGPILAEMLEEPGRCRIQSRYSSVAGSSNSIWPISGAPGDRQRADGASPLR